MTTTDNLPADPFANVKVPSISFKDQPIGTSWKGRVTSLPTMAQTIDFTTNKPAYWKNEDGTQGGPKMAAVFQIQVLDGPDPEAVGEIRSVWAAKPSSLFTAVAEAQQKFGRRIEVGGVIEITHVRNEKPANPKFNAQKIYSVEYEGPADEPVDDAFGTEDFKI